MHRWLLAVAAALVLFVILVIARSAREPPQPAAPSPPSVERSPPALEIDPPLGRAPMPATETETASISRSDQIRGALAAALVARGRNPSEVELERMTASLLRLMRAREAMRALRYDRSEGGSLRRLRDEVGEAVAEFEAVAGVPLDQLTAETAGGITRPDAIEREVVFEPMEGEPR